MHATFPARTRLFPLLLALCQLAFLDSAIAEPVKIPGTTVSVEPPPGFSVSERFSGLENPETGSTLMVVELPAEAEGELATIMSSVESAREAWAPRGIAINDLTRVDAGGKEIPIAIGTQSVGPRTITKYMAMLAGERTVLVSINVSDPDEIPRAKAEAIIASIRLLPAPTLEEELATLPFTFQPAGPFHVDQVVGGSGVLLIATAELDPSGASPIILIARALQSVDVSDPSLIGQQLIRGTVGFESADVVEDKAVDFAGHEGHYLKANAADRTAVQFLTVPEDGLYIRLIAMGQTAALQEAMPAIDEIAGSVKARN